MTVELANEIIKGQIIVLVIPNEEYTKKIVEVARYFSLYNDVTCYVSLNKLYDSLTASLTRANVNYENFLFLDGITKSANPDAVETDNCMYIDSSSALTELSIVLDKTLGTGKFDGFLFDSLSTLLIYNKGEAVSKFVHNIINKIHSYNATAIFTALEGDTKSDLLKEIGMYVDNVIHI
jgi:hypothetical protein